MTGKTEMKSINLKEVTDFFADGDWIESKDQSDTGFRLVQTGNVGIGRYLAHPDRARYISVETFDRLNCTKLNAGDILISRLPDPVGRACLFPGGFDAITAVDCTIVRVKKDLVLPEWVHFITQTQGYQKQVDAMLGGSTRLRITRKELGAIKIPLPPLAEQRRIAEILRTWDEAIEAAEAELKAKQERKRWLMDKLLTPSTQKAGARRINCWDVYKIGELCDVITGSTPSRTNSDYWNEGSVPWFTVDDIRKGGRVIHSTIQHVTESAVKESSLRLMPAGTVLLCCTASVGEYAITRVPITSNQQFNGLVIKSEFKDKLSAEFLFNIASTLREKLKGFCGKTSVDFVSGSNLKSIQIPLPSLAEQRKIAEILQSADSDVQTMNLRIESLRVQKRGLMQKLLTGEVRVAA